MPNRPSVLVFSRKGYIKRMPADLFATQVRGPFSFIFLDFMHGRSCSYSITLPGTAHQSHVACGCASIYLFREARYWHGKRAT